MNKNKDHKEELFLIEKYKIEDTLIVRNKKHLHYAHSSEVIQSGYI